MVAKFFLIDEDRRENAIDAIRALELNKGHVVEIKKGRRTLNQNDLWHEWIDLMAAEAGDTPEDMKIAIKRKILGMREMVCPLTGEVTYTDWQSSTMDKAQFASLMTNTQVLAMEYYGMSLPSKEDAPEWVR